VRKADGLAVRTAAGIGTRARLAGIRRCRIAATAAGEARRRNQRQPNRMATEHKTGRAQTRRQAGRSGRKLFYQMTGFVLRECSCLPERGFWPRSCQPLNRSRRLSTSPASAGLSGDESICHRAVGGTRQIGISGLRGPRRRACEPIAFWKALEQINRSTVCRQLGMVWTGTPTTNRASAGSFSGADNAATERWVNTTFRVSCGRRASKPILTHNIIWGPASYPARTLRMPISASGRHFAQTFARFATAAAGNGRIRGKEAAIVSRCLGRLSRCASRWTARQRSMTSR